MVLKIIFNSFMTIYRSLVKIYNLIIFQKCWCFFLFSLQKKNSCCICTGYFTKQGWYLFQKMLFLIILLQYKKQILNYSFRPTNCHAFRSVIVHSRISSQFVNRILQLLSQFWFIENISMLKLVQWEHINGKGCHWHRSSRSQMLFKTDALRNFWNIHRKHLCCSLYLISCMPKGLQLY